MSAAHNTSSVQVLVWSRHRCLLPVREVMCSSLPDSVFWHISPKFGVPCHLVGNTTVMLIGNCISSFYHFFLGEKILTDMILAYYVKQVISWLLVLHLAAWLDMFHSQQCCRIIFRRGQFTQRMSRPVSPSVAWKSFSSLSAGVLEWVPFQGLDLLFLALDSDIYLT